MAAAISNGGSPAGGGARAAIIAAFAIGLIYFGHDVLLPIALAVLLSFILAPVVRLLQKCWIPRVIAVLAAVLTTFVAMFAIGGTIALEATQLAAELPRYKSTIESKISSLRSEIAGAGPFARAAGILQDFGSELSKPVTAGINALSSAQPPQRAQKPVPVEVLKSPSGPFEHLSNVISSLLHPLATTGITFIYAAFILLNREDLRDRVIKLAGSHDLQKTTAALDDAGRRLSQLLLAQLAVNSSFGVIIGTALWINGVPNPVLWGILSAILRFIPYVGALISGLFPLTLAIAIEPGWSKAIFTIVLFISAEAFVGNFVEPLLYGRTSGLSPVALVISATFWAVVWGPIGLVLAAPMTICLAVIGRHVERLKFLAVMLGDEPALSPPEIFYHRMLVGDPAEEIDRAEKFLKDRPLTDYYEEVALAGLKLAQNDLSRGSLDLSHIEMVRNSSSEIVQELGEYTDRAAGTSIPVSMPEKTVLCVAGRSKLDECAALMLAQLLEEENWSAATESPEALSVSGISRLDAHHAAIIFLSYLDRGSPAHMRYAIRRLRKKLPGATIFLGCWAGDGKISDLRELVKADAVAFTLRDAVTLCAEAAPRPIALPLEKVN